MNWHVVIASKLNRTKRQHFAASASHLQHLIKTQILNLASLGNHARVGAKHPGDVGVDLARVGI